MNLYEVWHKLRALADDCRVVASETKKPLTLKDDPSRAFVRQLAETLAKDLDDLAEEFQEQE